MKANAKRKLALKVEKYKRMIESRRGHNFSYLTDEVYKELERKGYSQARFPNGKDSTHSESTAVGLVLELRKNGHYAQIYCVANRLRIKEYCVFYKAKFKTQPI